MEVSQTLCHKMIGMAKVEAELLLITLCKAQLSLSQLNGFRVINFRCRDNCSLVDLVITNEVVKVDS